MTPSQVILVLSASLAIFVIIRQLVQEILESEWGNEMYMKCIRSRSLEKAYSDEKQPQIDEEYYKFKLAQLSARETEKRRLALDYFDNVPIDPRLAEKLIEILPKQHHKDIQKRMAQLLCKTFSSLTKEKNRLNDDKPEPIRSETTIKEWSIAISIWLTEVFLIALLWFKLINLSFAPILSIGLFLFLVTIGALRIVLQDWRLFGKITLLASAVLLAGPWGYSKSTHTGIHPVQVENLKSYGLSDIGVYINYPNWLTADDIHGNKKIVSVLVLGNPSALHETLTLSFNYDPSIVKITDKRGNAISPRFEVPTTNPAGEPKEFFIQPVGRKALKRALPATTITTQIETKTMARQAIPELALHVQLEDPMWKTLRDVFFFLFSAKFGGVLGWIILDRLKKSRHIK